MKARRAARKDSVEPPRRDAPISSDSLVSAFQANLATLSSRLHSFSETHGFDPPSDSLLAAFVDWLTVDCEVYEKTTLAGASLDREILEEQTRLHLLANFDLYLNLGLKWRIRFSEKAVTRFAQIAEERQMLIVERLLEVAQGRIGLHRRSHIEQTGPMRHLVIFRSQLQTEGCLLLAFELNRIPNTDNGSLQGFRYHHFLRVVDILPNSEEVQSSLKQYVNLLRADPAKKLRPEEGKSDSRLVSLESSVEQLSAEVFGPKEISPELLSRRRQESYTFHEGLARWVDSAEREVQPWEDARVMKANAALISELADSESCKLLIEFMQAKKKEFPFKLSEEELAVIGAPGNVLAIGRSGTGKTTCAMLRLLASQALFRLRIRQQKRDTNGFFGLHSVFITASATLTLEVKRFYESLVAKLSKKALPVVAPTSEEDETELNERDLKIKPSTHLMKHEDFPMFSTTRLLVFAIDAGLRNPFFQVTQEGEGAAIQAGFHNELKGVKVISHLVRKEELDNDFDFQAEEAQFQAIAAPLYPSSEELPERGASFEVDFEYFERHFWPTVRARGSLSSALVWAEIAGKLKGSATSCTYATGHLPKEEYMTQHKKTSILGQGEREAVWTIFQQYERWKERKGAYDFQDVVTHALKEIALSGYEGAPVHFMMVDEVQDLSHATLLLLAKVTEQQLFFAGDTAQTIAKGSTFRFKELSTLFSAYGGLATAPPVTKQLLENYRSHNAVLKLANCIVRLIELLFPKTIDKLERERSNIEGDTPIVLMNPCLEEIVNALVVGESTTGGNVVYGSGQVVLVPDEEARKRLPEILQGALCLTIYESKGLEFDDVILFEFFENCGVTEDEWRMLKEVLYEDRNSIPADIFRPEWKPKFLQTFDHARHAALCSALKMLYVAITRTKRKFIVYDSSPSGKYLLDYMLTVGIVTKKVPRESGLSTDIGTVIQSEAGRTLWRNLGIKLMKLKFYAQAAKCFRYADDQTLRRKAESLHTADESARLLQAAEAILGDRDADIGSKQTAEVDKKRAIAQFVQVASDFQSLNLLRYAAQCFFSGQVYARAANIYKKLKAYNELGECLFAMDKYEDSGSSYTRAGNFLGALKAYDRGKLWIECMRTLKKVSSLSLQKRVSLIRKYSRAVTDDLLEEKSSRGLSAAAEAFIPGQTTLTSSERQSILSSLSTTDQVIPLSEAVIDCCARDVAQATDGGYGYSYLESYSMLPRGALVEFERMYLNPKVAETLINIAVHFEDEAVKVDSRAKNGRTITTRFECLPEGQHAEQAIRVYEVFHLKRLAFILASVKGMQFLIKQSIQNQGSALSPVHLISPQKLATPQWSRVSRYFATVAGKVLHECLEMVRPPDLKALSRTEDTLYPEWIVLGFWKKVVSLTPLHRIPVAAAFRDFQHVKFQYFAERGLHSSRIKQLLDAQQTWPDQVSEPLDRESLLSILEETITVANRTCNVTLYCETDGVFPIFHRRFPKNRVLWTFIDARGREGFEADLTSVLGLVCEEMSCSAARSGLDCFAIFDIFSFFAQFVFSMKTESVQAYLDKLSFRAFEKVLQAFKFWVTLFSRRAPAKGYIPNYDWMLRATFMPFAVSILPGNDYLAGIPIYTHALIRTNSLLFPEICKQFPSLISVDIEGEVFLAPIAELLRLLQLQAVRLLTDSVLRRKALYAQYRFADSFPFISEEDYCNEKLRARTAACIYGELAHLRTIQEFFPEEYRFVGELGLRLKERNARQLAELAMKISELSGDEYAADDPTFADFLRKKNKEEIRKLERTRRDLLKRKDDLKEEQEADEELEEFISSLPLDIHHELIWMFEPRLPLTNLAHLHLRQYINEEAVALDPNKDFTKLRMLDNIARLCSCQNILFSVPKMRPLLFPEVEYTAGNLLEVIKQSLGAVRYLYDQDVPDSLRRGLELKEKFQIVQKCVLWSFVLYKREIILPSVLAIQLTRYYGHKQKQLQKRFIAVRSLVLIECLETLAELVSVTKASDPCSEIARCVFHTLVVILANAEMETRLVAAYRKVTHAQEIQQLCEHEPLLRSLLGVKDPQCSYFPEFLRRTKSIEGALNEVRLWTKARLAAKAAEKRHQAEQASAAPGSEAPSRLPPEQKPHLRIWNVGQYQENLERVFMNDPLTTGESSQLREDFFCWRVSVGDVDIAFPGDLQQPINQYEDLLLLSEFNRKLIYTDAYQEFKLHFPEQFAALHRLSECLYSQLDLYHHKADSPQQRQVVLSSITRLIISTIRLKHDLLEAIVHCRSQHDGEPEQITPEESCVRQTQSEVDGVIRLVSRIDLSKIGRDVNEESDCLAGTEETGTKWKVTRKISQ